MTEDLTVKVTSRTQLNDEIADLFVKSAHLRSVSRSLRASSTAIRSANAAVINRYENVIRMESSRALRRSNGDFKLEAA